MGRRYLWAFLFFFFPFYFFLVWLNLATLSVLPYYYFPRLLGLLFGLLTVESTQEGEGKKEEQKE